MNNSIDTEALNVELSKLLHKFYDISDENKKLKMQIEKLTYNTYTKNSIVENKINNQNKTSTNPYNISNTNTSPILNTTLNNINIKAPQQTKKYIKTDNVNIGNNNENEYSTQDINRIQDLIDSFKQ
jgi:hypothetical protein